MHHFTVDYLKRKHGPGTFLNRGYFLHGLPRLLPVCRILGHKPIVDGYNAEYGNREQARWVTCDRCGITPDPHGTLDPTQWSLGQRYTGPFGKHLAEPLKVSKRLDDAASIPLPSPEPGPWPEAPTSDIGAQLIIGRARTTGIGFKVGNRGSEQVLAAHISIGPIGALYVHAEDHGRWIQRRLNPTGYESRETGVSIHDSRLWWNIWSPRNEHNSSDPAWMRGSVHIDPRHYLLGPIKAHKEDATEKIPAVVCMPDGTRYDVTVQLEKWTRGRTRGRKSHSWTISWNCQQGIPVRNHDWKGDKTLGGSFPFPAVSADVAQWVDVACAMIATSCSEDRARYNYRAPAA